MLGFFGIPVEDQYNLEVMIESPSYNCTLSPYAIVSLGGLFPEERYAEPPHQCSNDNGKLGAIAGARTQAWENVFLAKAIKRLQPLVGGYSLTTRDVKDFMEVCTELCCLAFGSGRLMCHAIDVRLRNGIRRLLCVL
jgi:hypothetical protein